MVEHQDSRIKACKKINNTLSVTRIKYLGCPPLVTNIGEISVGRKKLGLFKASPEETRRPRSSRLYLSWFLGTRGSCGREGSSEAAVWAESSSLREFVNI